MDKEKSTNFKSNLKKCFYSFLYQKDFTTQSIDIAFKICKKTFKEYSSNKFESVLCVTQLNSVHVFKLFKIPLFEIGIGEYIPDLSNLNRYIEKSNGKVYCFDLLGFYLDIEKNHFIK